MPQRALGSKRTNVRANLSLAALRAALRALGAVAPDLAAAWLASLFLSTRRTAMPEREARWLRAAEWGAIEADGEALATYSWGDGPLVLLVHGWNGRGSQLGGLALALAERGHRAVALDLPGHGESPGSSSSLLAMAAGLEAAMRQLGAPVGVVAHSAGCAATTLALQDAVATPALAFIAPPQDLGYFALELARQLRVQPRVHRRARRGIEARFGIPWSQLRIPALAPEMTQPLLVIHDALDREVPHDHGARVAASWPGARLHTTRGLGHQRILRDEDVVRRAVRFVTRREERGEIAS
jgi:pimeloyl-ACP methyl ester carboxylesterase